LCGQVLDAHAGRRYKKHDTMADLVLSKCIPTAFVYSCAVMHREGGGKHTVCIACVNWIRRLSLHKSRELIFIPMDNVIMFVMEPGKHPEPDKRTLLRLLRSLCMAGPGVNHYSCFESGTMRLLKQVLVERYFDHGEVRAYEKDTLVDAIVRAWWIYNGMPTFLQDKTTGRYVRRMLRAHKLLSLRM
jgi:hypothetical protein